jgi:hypothetical protein
MHFQLENLFSFKKIICLKILEKNIEWNSFDKIWKKMIKERKKFQDTIVEMYSIPSFKYILNHIKLLSLSLKILKMCT